MPSTSTQHPGQPLSPKRTDEGHTPSGCRVLHVVLREDVFNHTKAQAYLSGIRFQEFVARVLAESHPLEPLNQSNVQPSQQ